MSLLKLTKHRPYPLPTNPWVMTQTWNKLLFAHWPIYYASTGSLDDWLTARYCLYTINENQLYRGEIHHAPWPLQQAEAAITANAMHALLTSSILQSKPVLHYVEHIKALFWLLDKV